MVSHTPKILWIMTLSQLALATRESELKVCIQRELSKSPIKTRYQVPETGREAENVAKLIREFTGYTALKVTGASKEVDGDYIRVNRELLAQLRDEDALHGIHLKLENLGDTLYVQTRSESKIILAYYDFSSCYKFWAFMEPTTDSHEPDFFASDPDDGRDWIKGYVIHLMTAADHADVIVLKGNSISEDAREFLRSKHKLTDNTRWLDIKRPGPVINGHPPDFKLLVLNDDPPTTESIGESGDGIEQVVPTLTHRAASQDRSDTVTQSEAVLRRRPSSLRSAREYARPTAPDGAAATHTWAQRCGRGFRRVAQVLCPNQED